VCHKKSHGLRWPNAIFDDGYDASVPPWLGTVYFEDVSAESSFELILVIAGTVPGDGDL
jgi:hypothetical protein